MTNPPNNPQELDGQKYIDSILAGMPDEKVFKPEYQGHEPEFLADLQKIHDNSFNWDEKGLTPYGQEQVRQLKEMYVD